MSIEISPQSVGVTPPSAFLEVRDLRVHFPTEHSRIRSTDLVYGLIDPRVRIA